MFIFSNVVIELTDGDHEQNIEILAKATQNGKLSLYKSESEPIQVPFLQNNNNNNNNNEMLPLNNNTGKINSVIKCVYLFTENLGYILAKQDFHRFYLL